MSSEQHGKAEDDARHRVRHHDHGIEQPAELLALELVQRQSEPDAERRPEPRDDRSHPGSARRSTTRRRSCRDNAVRRDATSPPHRRRRIPILTDK
jgi:hypothetical protein